VTIGNVVGGALMVGAITVVYLRGKETSDDDTGGNQRFGRVDARRSGRRTSLTRASSSSRSTTSRTRRCRRLLAHDSVYGEFPAPISGFWGALSIDETEIPFFVD
jgi:hypothetical protein